jgi:exonuclease V gamma subunit
MYIANQTFKDEDTLIEAIFDFSLGEPTELVNNLLAGIQKDLLENSDFQEYRATLDEESQDELDAGEQDIRLAEKLMGLFDSFKIEKQQLFGLKNNHSTLLYSIDLV